LCAPQRLTYREKEKLRTLFDLYDVKKQGFLTIRELMRAVYTSLDVITQADIVGYVEEVRGRVAPQCSRSWALFYIPQRAG
jgi:Ca2+-binding EF-hand superfamily protein